jgi:hypothetical protein
VRKIDPIPRSLTLITRLKISFQAYWKEYC